MKITFDKVKRAETIAERGLDFADAERVFAGTYFSRRDDRQDYGEDRFISVGRLDEKVVILVWTPRGGSRRIISMRKANAKERTFYAAELRRARRSS